MVAVPNTSRYVVEGSLPGGEAFAFGWAATGPNQGTVNAQAAVDATLASSQFAAFLAAIKVIANTGCAFQRLRLYVYGNGGLLVDSAFAAITGVSGTGSPKLPNQCALAVSLRSAINTRSGRGRMYLPATGATVDATTGKMTNSLATIASTTAALMASTQGQIASETQAISRPVVRVSVGDVVDTIRARRNRLVEAYTNANV
jgi:hypothetical protein